jgi:CRISPR-associated exonuclease Cas4
MYEAAARATVSIAFSDLARAAYCPRQLYYARREDDRGPPASVRERASLAHRYGELRDADDATIADCPVALPPPAYREALASLATREDWPALAGEYERDVYLEGRDSHGVAAKVLDVDPPVPTLVSPGTPPERGVWEPQRVRAVAAAKALAWERERQIPRALVEYPAHGEVRTVRLTTGNRAAYRRTVRTVRQLDGPPPRVDDAAKCEPCDYREQCGVRTRSLRSLLGL